MIALIDRILSNKKLSHSSRKYLAAQMIIQEHRRVTNTFHNYF